MRRSSLAALVALATLAPAPAIAAADTKALIRDCEDGRIDGSYSQKEFSDAVRSIPTDLEQYTDCRDVLRRAQLGAAGGSGASGGDGDGAGGAAGGGAPGASGPSPTSAQLLESASPAERAAITEAIGEGGAAPVRIGGRSVSPESTGLSPAGAANVVPTPLIVALALLAVALLAGGTQTIRSLVLERRAPAT